MSEPIVIGIDGGGTRSEGVVVDLDGRELVRVNGGPLNYCTTSVDEFGSVLGALLGKVRELIGTRPCLAATIGTAALFERASDDESQRILAGVDLGGFGEVELVGDALTAVYGATQGRAGTLVIAGTGSIGIQLGADSRIKILGGLGPMLGGDPGSAFWMASEAVAIAQRHLCERGGLCPLGVRIIESFGAKNLSELVSHVHVNPSGRSRLAAVSAELSTCEDAAVVPFWQPIEEDAGRRLALLLQPMASNETESSSVFFSGSVLTGNAQVRESFRVALSELWKRAVVLEEPLADAPMGAAWMALAKISVGNGN